MKKFTVVPKPESPPKDLPEEGDISAALRELVSALKEAHAKPPEIIRQPTTEKTWNKLTVKISRDPRGDMSQLVFTKS